MKKTLFLLAMATMSLSANAEMRWIGDADGDGQLTTADVRQLTQYVLGKTPLPKDIKLLDVDGDKKVTIADVVRLIYLLANPSEATQTWIPENIPTNGEKGPFD